jgi:2-iminobutanoate/2-iminopropanoate deaminase
MKTIITTESAPAAIGPYNQAVRVGNLLFLSGQIALDPSSGSMVGATAAEQATQVMKNLAEVLAAAGGTLASLVKTTMYLSDLAAFGAVNEVYGSFFMADAPARATVEVSRLPRSALVEIDGIAVLGE